MDSASTPGPVLTQGAVRRPPAALALVRDVVLVALGVLLVVSAVSYTVLQISGTTFYRITSPSMTGTLDVGSVVAVRSVSPWDVEADDIIAIGDESVEVPTIHRVMAVNQPFPDVRQVFTDSRDGSSLGERWQRAPRTFVTKGDANPSNDPRPVPGDEVRGKVILRIPAFLGFLPRLAGQGTLIVAGVGSLLVYGVWQGWDIVQARRREPEPTASGEPIEGG